MLMLAAAPEDPGKCEYETADKSWFVDADYPAEARARGEQGAVVYRLEVDAEGCTTACEVVRGSGFPALDAATCPVLMRRARFKAARDAAGQRVPASFLGSRWWLIAEPPAPGVTPPEPRRRMSSWVTRDDYPPAAMRADQQGNVGFRLEIDATGFPTGCTVWQSSGVPVLDTATCSLMMRRARFTPARDAAGTAVPGVFVNGIAWILP
jgi:TonB family protein